MSGRHTSTPLPPPPDCNFELDLEKLSQDVICNVNEKQNTKQILTRLSELIKIDPECVVENKDIFL
jgi:hypothetical protein